MSLVLTYDTYLELEMPSARASSIGSIVFRSRMVSVDECPPKANDHVTVTNLSLYSLSAVNLKRKHLTIEKSVFLKQVSGRDT